MLLVLGLDWFTPLGAAVPMLYVVPVFIAGLLLTLGSSTGVATLGTLLTILIYEYVPKAGDPSLRYTNCLIACVLIWLTLLMAWIVCRLCNFRAVR